MKLHYLTLVALLGTFVTAEAAVHAQSSTAPVPPVGSNTNAGAAAGAAGVRSTGAGSANVGAAAGAGDTAPQGTGQIHPTQVPLDDFHATHPEASPKNCGPSFSC